MTHIVGPDRLIAAWWAIMTGLLTAGAVWLVLDSDGGWPFLALLGGSVLVWGWFLVPALLPGMHTLRLDEHGMSGRFLWRRIEIPWNAVHLLRVDALAGDSLLEITLAADGRTRLIPLPVGTSTSKLHDVLAATIGSHAATSNPTDVPTA